MVLNVKNRTNRIDVELFSPVFLNQFTSYKQIEFVLQCAKQHFLGYLPIHPTHFANLLSTSVSNVRKMIHICVDMGILTRQSRHIYRFNYYKHMSKDERGYVRLYSFLFEPRFGQASLKAQRVVLHLLQLLAGVSHRTEIAIHVNIKHWYGDSDSERVFPFWHRSEVLEVIPFLEQFFVLDTSRLLETNTFVLKGLHNVEVNRVEYCSSAFTFITDLLDSKGIYYCHEVHKHHLINLFESFEYQFGFDRAYELFQLAFDKMNWDCEQQSLMMDIVRRFIIPPEETEHLYSTAVVMFRDHFIIPTLQDQTEELHHKLKQSKLALAIVKRAKGTMFEEAIRFFEQRIENLYDRAELFVDYVEKKYLKNLNENLWNATKKLSGEELYNYALKRTKLLLHHFSENPLFHRINPVITGILDSIERQARPVREVQLPSSPPNWLGN